MDQYRRVYEGFVKVLAEKCKAHGLSISGLKVLDVGCFTGDFLELLHRCGVDGYGVELQQEAVAIGNQRLPGRIFKGDVYSLGVGEQHFDCVTLLGVIEHVVDPMGILRECRKLLRPGGILMVETPNPNPKISQAARACATFA